MDIVKERKNIVIGVFLSYALLVFNVLSGLFYTPFLLSKVGDVNYGLYSFVYSITSWFTLLSSALLPSFVRFATKEHKVSSDSKKTNTIFVLLLLAFTILSILAGLVILILFKTSIIPLSNYSSSQKETIIILLFISTISVSFSIFTSIFDVFISYKKEFIFSRFILLVGQVLIVLLGILMLRYGKDVIGIMIVHSISTFFVSLSYFLYSIFKLKFKLTKFSLKTDSKLVRQIIIFSSFLLLNQIVNSINNQVDQTILGFMVTPIAVTTYTLAQTFKTYYSSLSISISSTFVPRVHEYVVSDEKEKYSSLFVKVSTIQLFIVCMITGGFISCGREFINVWLSGPRDDVYVIALVLLFINIVPLSNNLSVEIQRAMNKHKFRALTYFLIALINVGISIALVFFLPADFKIYGCLIGTVIAIISGGWIALNIYNSLVIGLPMKKYWISFAKCFSAAIISSLIVLGVSFFVNGMMVVGGMLQCLRNGITFLGFYFLFIFLFFRKERILSYFKPL